MPLLSHPPLFLDNHTSPPALSWLLHQILLGGNTATTAALPPHDFHQCHRNYHCHPSLFPSLQSLPHETRVRPLPLKEKPGPRPATSQPLYAQGSNILGGDLPHTSSQPTYNTLGQLLESSNSHLPQLQHQCHCSSNPGVSLEPSLECHRPRDQAQMPAKAKDARLTPHDDDGV